MRGPTQRCGLMGACRWFALLAMCGVMTTSAFYDNVPHLCRDKPSGVTRLPSRRCDAYLECFAGMAFMRLCAPGTSFNLETSACDKPRDATCTPQGVHQIHGSEAQEFKHLLYSATPRNTSQKPPSPPPKEEHIFNDPTQYEIENSMSTEENDLEDAITKSDKENLDKSDKVGYHPTIIITSPVRFVPSGVGLGRRLRRSVNGLLKAGSQGMQVAHSMPLLDSNPDMAVGNSQVQAKTAIRLSSLNNNHQQQVQHGSQLERQDQEIQQMQKQLDQLEKLKKQQQKLQRILMKNPTGPLAQTLMPYLRYHTASSQGIKGKTASAGPSNTDTARKEFSYTKKKKGNSHRFIRRFFGSPKSMLPFETRPTMPPFDPPRRRWRFRSQHSQRIASGKKSHQNQRSHPSSDLLHHRSGYPNTSPSRISNSGRLPHAYDAEELDYPSSYADFNNGPNGSRDEKIMMKMFNKLKAETKDESYNIATNFNPDSLGSSKRYDKFMNESRREFQPYRSTSHYSKNFDDYYSPRYGGARSIGGSFEYDDNYNRYAKNTQMYGPYVSKTDFGNGGDYSRKDQGDQQGQAQEEAVTATPIWIHPFAQEGAYSTNDDSQTQSNGDQDYESPSSYENFDSNYPSKAYTGGGYHSDGTATDKRHGRHSYHEGGEYMSPPRGNQQRYHKDNAYWDTPSTRNNYHQSNRYAKDGKSRSVRKEHHQYRPSSGGTIYKNRPSTGYLASNHREEYHTPNQYYTERYQSQQKQASYRPNNEQYTQKQYIYDDNTNYNQERKDEEYAYVNPRKYPAEMEKENNGYDDTKGYAYTSDHDYPSKGDSLHNDYSNSYAEKRQGHENDYSTSQGYSYDRRRQHLNSHNNNGYQGEGQENHNDYTINSDFSQRRQGQHNSYDAKRGYEQESQHKRNGYNENRKYDDQDNRHYQRDDKEQEDRDPYQHEKNRERSDRITDPDSYYNADNPGPWGRDDHKLPPEATYNGGDGGDGVVRSMGEGGNPAEEGGTHAQYGRKPPEFDTFPFNFMPKHLTGFMFTDTGNLDFKKDSGYGHVADIELDGNGDVQYDDTDHRVAPKKVVEHKMESTTSDVENGPEEEDTKKPSKEIWKEVVHTESDGQENATGDNQDSISPKEKEAPFVAEEVKKIKVRRKRHTRRTYQSPIKKAGHAAYASMNSHQHIPNYQHPSRYKANAQLHGHPYPPRLESKPRYFPQQGNMRRQLYLQHGVYPQQYSPRHNRDSRNLISPQIPNAPNLPKYSPTIPKTSQPPAAPKTPNAPKMPKLNIDTRQYLPELSQLQKAFEVSLNIDLPLNDGGFANQWQGSKFPSGKESQANKGYGVTSDQWHSPTYLGAKLGRGIKGYGDTFYQRSSDPYNYDYSGNMKNIYGSDSDFKKLYSDSKSDHQDFGFKDDLTKENEFYMKKPEYIKYPSPVRPQELSLYNLKFDSATLSPKYQKQIFLETIHVGTGAPPDRTGTSDFEDLFGKSLDTKGFGGIYDDKWSSDKWSNGKWSDNKWFTDNEWPEYKWPNDKWFNEKYPSEDPWAAYSMDDRMNSKYGASNQEDGAKGQPLKTGSASKFHQHV